MPPQPRGLAWRRLAYRVAIYVDGRKRCQSRMFIAVSHARCLTALCCLFVWLGIATQCWSAGTTSVYTRCDVLPSAFFAGCGDCSPCRWHGRWYGRRPLGAVAGGAIGAVIGHKMVHHESTGPRLANTYVRRLWRRVIAQVLPCVGCRCARRCRRSCGWLGGWTGWFDCRRRNWRCARQPHWLGTFLLFAVVALC